MPTLTFKAVSPRYIGTNGKENRPEFSSINPTTGEVYAIGHASTVHDVKKAAVEALVAQRAWAALTGAQRAERLHAWATVIEFEKEALGKAIAEEVGKPIAEALGEAGRCVSILRYFAGQAVNADGLTIPSLVAHGLQWIQRRPVGLIGLITPWNFPLAIPLWKAAPALAFGNAVLLKPSEHSIFCADLLAKSAIDSGLPEGIFNVLPGLGDVGEALCESPYLRGISFTGSVATGKKVIEACAKTQKKVQAEMGGKNPSLILKDADLKLAAGLVAGASMRFAGQKCTATSRAIVDKSVTQAFLSELKIALDKLQIGDPCEASTAIGPVISEASQSHLLHAIKSSNAKKFYATEVPNKGFFVQPTVFTGVDPESDLAQKELFGPVLAVLEVNGLDEALEMANAVPFGLSASLFTKDLTSAMTYAHRIEAGMVRINADTTGLDPHAPFGGVKASSYGLREQGPAAREFYTESITVQINP